jgi:hypothetical protein
VMLFGLALAASLLAGYGMTGSKARSWLHTWSWRCRCTSSSISSTRAWV